MIELYRFFRHLFAPLVVFAVEKGWLPEYARNDVVEVLVMGTAFAVPYIISWWRDPKRRT